MPVFEVESGGRRFEVDAPDRAAAIGALGGEGSQQSWGQYAGGLARQAAQGLTFSTADEIEAWLRSRGGGDYNREVSRIRRENEQFAGENPGASFTANLVGGLPLFVGPGGAATGLARAGRWAASGATLPRTIARSAGLGAGIGGASGLGAGEGNILEGDFRRLGSAATGAGLGAGLGGVVPPIASGIANVGSRFIPSRRIPGTPREEPPVWPAGAPEPQGPISETGARPRPPTVEGARFVDTRVEEALNAQGGARRLFADQLLREGTSVDDIRAALKRWDDATRLWTSGRAQNPTALIDVSEALARQTGSLARAYPEVARDVSGLITARQTGMTPPNASAQALAQRGIPTRGRFDDPLTGAQARAQLGANFRTPKERAVPMGQGDRLRDDLERMFLISDRKHHGHGKTGLETVKMIVTRARGDAQKTLGEAYTVNASVNLRGAVDPVFAAALKRAAAEEAPTVESAIAAVQRLFRPGQALNLQLFQRTKEVFDNRIKALLSKPGTVHVGGVLNDLKNQLRDAVIKATGGDKSLYGKFIGEFADEMTLTRAYLRGLHAFDEQPAGRTGPLRELIGDAQTTAQDFAALATKAEQKLMRYGLSDATMARSQNISAARSNLDIFNTPRLRQLVAAMVPGDKSRASRMSDLVDMESAFINTRDIVRGGSTTMRNANDDLALGGMEMVQNVRGFIEAFRGSQGLWDLGQRLFGRIMDRLFGMNAEIAREYSRMVFTANRAEQEAILASLIPLMAGGRGARFNELMRRSQQYLAPGAAGAAGNVGGAQPPGPPSFV